MPEVTVWPSPNGSPMATTKSPTRRSFEARQRNRLQAVGRDLQHGQVGVRIRADHARLDRAVVVQGHVDVVGALGDMVVGQHIALGRIDDHARAERLLDALARLVRDVEEAPEYRVVEERIAHLHAGLRVDVDHGRRDPVDHRRQSRQRLAIDCRRQAGLRRSRRDRPRSQRRESAAMKDEATGFPVHGTDSGLKGVERRPLGATAGAGSSNGTGDARRTRACGIADVKNDDCPASARRQTFHHRLGVQTASGAIGFIGMADAAAKNRAPRRRFNEI